MKNFFFLVVSCMTFACFASNIPFSEEYNNAASCRKGFFALSLPGSFTIFNANGVQEQYHVRGSSTMGSIIAIEQLSLQNPKPVILLQNNFSFQTQAANNKIYTYFMKDNEEGEQDVHNSMNQGHERLILKPLDICSALAKKKRQVG